MPLCWEEGGTCCHTLYLFRSFFFTQLYACCLLQVEV